MIINQLKDWSKRVIPGTFKGTWFIPDCSSILAEEECARLASYIKHATYSERECFQAKDVQTILGIQPWPNQLRRMHIMQPLWLIFKP